MKHTFLFVMLLLPALSQAEGESRVIMTCGDFKVIEKIHEFIAFGGKVNLAEIQYFIGRGEDLSKKLHREGGMPTPNWGHDYLLSQTGSLSSTATKLGPPENVDLKKDGLMVAQRFPEEQSPTFSVVKNGTVIYKTNCVVSEL